MKVQDLSGAQLDYYTALADGIPAEELSIRRIPRGGYSPDGDDHYLVRTWYYGGPAGMAFSTDWIHGGPLVDKFRPIHMPALTGGWSAAAGRSRFVQGDTALQAICRAIVCDKFGEEVDEVGVAP